MGWGGFVELILSDPVPEEDQRHAARRQQREKYRAHGEQMGALHHQAAEQTDQKQRGRSARQKCGCIPPMIHTNAPPLPGHSTRWMLSASAIMPS